ncbi:succinate dehydrogenase, hydrophobic membrane anchor protein [Aestuariibius sp. 2305UL40-4]|uniref:succinate dehydrogenase, hydrophobic membrane anchor protein n=1 Tax=Aestuariibius violaceus TaxID=3234132 RepID=UPI00345F14E8
MSFMTDRKRAIGLGSAKTGTDHHWSMMVSSAALLILMPLFLFTFGYALGKPYEEVIAYYSQPLPALIAALTFGVGLYHFKGGVQVLIEDYTAGFTRKLLIVVMSCISIALAAAGIFAVARIAI